jgi:SNF2 family DNA or RNA helicase
LSLTLLYIRFACSDDSDDSVAEEKVALAEVEDLCNDSSYEEWETDEVLEFRKKWKRSEFESREETEKKQNRYLARDDVYLKNAGARVTKVDKDTDEEAARREFAFVSFKSNDGVPIRRDVILAMRQNATCQKRSLSFRRKDETRTRKLSPSSHGSNVRSPTQVQSKNTVNSPRKCGGLSLTKTLAPTLVRNRDQIIETDPVVECRPFIGDTFWDSCVELCSEDEGNDTRTVRVASALASKLKPHQVDGVKFMWQNSCKDLSSITNREEAVQERDIGGCILAHLMGLGKFPCMYIARCKAKP